MTTATLSLTEIDELHQAESQQIVKDSEVYSLLLDRKIAGDKIGGEEIMLV